uniref:winged helix-turn-helix domain-containing protein n=1 Tax=Thaumasiovibrio occultus TaxID=1891184 RepID=UPI00131B693A|nr:response regulator transcription factor [Thaumasiovibrio occultus]
MSRFTELSRNINILLVSHAGYCTEHVKAQVNYANFFLTECLITEVDVSSDIWERFDVVLLVSEEFCDDDLHFLSAIRSRSTVPVLAIVYEYSLHQCNLCFEIGGDDYVAGPKHLEELPSRIIATLRRSQRISAAISRSEMLLDELYLNRTKGVVKVGGKLIELTSIQFTLLWVLATYRTKVLDKPFLYKTVLEKDFASHDRSLDMHMSRVRKKLVQAGLDSERLKTVHGVGYCLKY